MGRSKAGLFLDRVAAAAAPVFDRVIAVERPGAEPLPIETIFEQPHEDDAPVFGVARALGHAPGPCFILAVDFALIRSDILAFLRARFESSNASMLVPRWDGRPQLLCAGYRTCIEPLLAERIAARRYDLTGLLHEADAEIIEEAALRAKFAGEPLMNVNTPADLAEAERIR